MTQGRKRTGPRKTAIQTSHRIKYQFVMCYPDEQCEKSTVEVRNFDWQVTSEMYFRDLNHRKIKTLCGLRLRLSNPPGPPHAIAVVIERGGPTEVSFDRKVPT